MFFNIRTLLSVVVILTLSVSFGLPAEDLTSDGDFVRSQLKLVVSNDYGELTTVYDPIWLASIWPKLRNGPHFSLDPWCYRNLTEFFQDMLDGRAWTLSAIDSTGSFGSGLLWGNNYWLGSKEQCKDLDSRYIDLKANSTQLLPISNKYFFSLKQHGDKSGLQKYSNSGEKDAISRIIRLDNTPPYRMEYSTVTLNINITKITLQSSHLIMMGVCLPRSCKSHDVRELLDFSIKMYQNLGVSGTLPRAVRILGVRTIDREYNLFDDTKFLLICSITFFVILLIISGTLIDVSNDERYLDREYDASTPTFKSFVKSEYVDSVITSRASEISLEFAMNPEYEKTIRALHLSQIKSKSIESIHKIDGLIPNRYTEIVSTLCPEIGFKRNHAMKYMIRSDPNVMMDMELNREASFGNMTILSEDRTTSTKQKYVISSKELTFLSRCVQRFKLRRFQQMMVNDNSSLAKVLMCFSLKKNAAKILSLDVGDDTLSPIHGLKVITLLWIILIHTCLVVFHLSDNKFYRTKLEMNFLFQTISNGTYSVDTFFVLSGLLVSYLFYQTHKRYSTESLPRCDGFLGKMLQYVGIVIYRYIRLTPPYLLTLGLVEISSRYLSSNSSLELPGKDEVNCERHWWRNALYVNTFYPLKEMCMSWSWYLSNDTQFYAVGVIFLILSVKYVKMSAFLVFLCLIAGWVTTALITLRTGHIPSIENPLSHYDDLYDKIWLRVGPYTCGLVAGWGLSKIKCCLILSKTVSSTLWIMSVVTIVSIVYGLYGNEMGIYGSVIYVTLSHTAWGFAITWIMIACVTGYGGVVNSILSCRWLYPLSRLCYCTYLLHPLLLKIIFLSSEMVQHTSALIIFLYFIGITIVSFGTALIVSLMFEAPAVSLLRILNPIRNSARDAGNTNFCS